MSDEVTKEGSVPTKLPEMQPAVAVKKFVVLPASLGGHFRRGDVPTEEQLRERGADHLRLLKKGSIRPATEEEAKHQHVALDATDTASPALEEQLANKDKKIAQLTAERDAAHRELSMVKASRQTLPDSGESDEKFSELIKEKDKVISDLQNRVKNLQEQQERNRKNK